MSDPKRLLTSDDAGSIEREMLASWRSEGPSADARAKTLAALGLGAGLAASGAAATGSIAPKATAGIAALVKWIGAAVVVGTVSTAAIVVVHSRSTPAPTPPPVLAQPTNAPIVPSNPAPIVAPTADVPAIDPTSLPVAPATSQPHAAHKAPSPDLGAQIALVDRARASLAAGDTATAIDLARRYRAEYPGGQLAQEADVVEIDALQKSGDVAGAKAAARRFLAAHPSSPHDAQVRAAAGL